MINDLLFYHPSHSLSVFSHHLFFPKMVALSLLLLLFSTLYKATVELCRKVLATNLLNVTSFLVMTNCNAFSPGFFAGGI
jgi:hypothetical protein